MASWTLAKLARIVILILRMFRIHEPIEISERVALKPSKRLTLLELAEQCSNAQITDRVRQRLVCSSSRNGSSHNSSIQMPSVLPVHVRQLLSNPSWTRTDADIEEACQSMQICTAFCDYQSHIQLILCRIGWYQRLEPGRVILKAGHPAGGLYFVLSGTVVVYQEKMDFGTEVAKTVGEGSTFGGGSVLAEAKQPTTCMSGSHVEIFAIGRCLMKAFMAKAFCNQLDYIDLSLWQGRISYQSSKHISFCRAHESSGGVEVILLPTIGQLQFLPLHLLDQQPEMINIAYYRKGSVIVKDSTKSDWIYVVMNGTCQVVKTFASTTSMQHDDVSNSDSSVNAFKLAKSNSRTRQLLVQLQNLSCKDVFGLSRMVYEDEPSVILVSRGAQLVLISKEFVQVHMHKAVQANLRKELLQFPSEDTMLKRVKEHHNWSIYKEMLMKKMRLD